MLDDELLTYFHEFEARDSIDAKFAKSVDALVPFLHEISHLKITKRKLGKYNFSSEDMRAEKEKYFHWGDVMAD